MCTFRFQLAVIGLLGAFSLFGSEVSPLRERDVRTAELQAQKKRYEKLQQMFQKKEKELRREVLKREMLTAGLAKDVSRLSGYKTINISDLVPLLERVLRGINQRIAELQAEAQQAQGEKLRLLRASYKKIRDLEARFEQLNPEIENYLLQNVTPETSQFFERYLLAKKEGMTSEMLLNILTSQKVKPAVMKDLIKKFSAQIKWHFVGTKSLHDLLMNAVDYARNWGEGTVLDTLLNEFYTKQYDVLQDTIRLMEKEVSSGKMPAWLLNQLKKFRDEHQTTAEWVGRKIGNVKKLWPFGGEKHED